MFAHLAQVSATGSSVCEIAEDLAVATGEWYRALDDLGSTFRLQEATEAVEAMRDAWHGDFGVYRAVIEKWCLAAKASAAGYESVDEYLAAQIDVIHPTHGPM